MARTGRISLLVSHELRTLVQACKEAPREIAKQLRAHTKAVVGPVWQEAVRANVTTRLETRVLSDTATVAVSDANVTLKSATKGRLSSGTAAPLLAGPAEFGMEAGRMPATSRRGKQYMRVTGLQFKFWRQRGYVVWPAAQRVIPRLASLWIQTWARGLYDALEKGAR